MKHLIVFVLLLVPNLFAQVIPQVNIPLIVTDGVKSRTLYFGLDPTATNGIDVHLGEMEQPPLPPSGVFDARFIGHDINIPELGEGVLKDYRNGSSTFQGQHIHELRYQVSTGTTIRIIWNFPSGITGVLQDFFGGIVVNKSMTGRDSIVITNPGIINKLKMTINYNLTGQLPPSIPNLLSPLNGSTNVSINPTLQWTIVSGSSQYQLQVSRDSFFTQLVFNDSSITINSTVVQIQSKTRYFWRVRAKNNAGWGQYSQIWNFTTAAAIPEPPVLHSPPKGASGIKIPVLLKWFSSTEAETYTIIIATDSNFINAIVNVSVSDTFLTVSELQTNEKYFWKVYANNLSGTSNASESWYFTTLSTTVRDQNFLPEKLTLHQNYPNPFNSITKISYQLPADSFTKFLIYNSNGQRILDYDMGYQKAGSYQIVLDFSTIKLGGANIPSGIYFYELIVNQNSIVRKMAYTK